MTTLLSRVLAATGPDRELDAAICVALMDVSDAEYFKLGAVKPSNAHVDWRVDLVNDTGVVRSMPPDHYTASLDAALALCERVLPGVSPAVGQNVHHIYWHARLSTLDEKDAPITAGEASASTPALALLAAILKAMEARDGGVV